MDFSLSQLTEIYVQELMPYVRRKTDNTLIRLDVYYKHILALKFGIGVGEDGQRLRPTDRQEELAKEIFGDRVIDSAPPGWYYAEAFLAAEKMPHQWEAIPMHSRAKWLAAKQVEGMIRGLERYRDVIDRKNKEALSKLKPAKSAPPKRRRH